MAEYIDREAAINAIEAVPDGNWKNTRYVTEISAIPAADVAPVVHAHKVTHNRPISGYWVSGDKIHNGIFQEIERVWVEPIMDNPVDYCSACGSRLDDTFQHYCPNCGARMDESEDEEDG